ncbi:MAG: CsbD family protein [Gammaproteobacteria bacterium HGW-Gammaproteobacteria-11]|nr:MAG: CsbD family protein [Gammaproteobacteria bacterium HGW-Gammaproteobacteria-11]
MSSTIDKIKGTTNEVVGESKKKIGKAIGNEQLEAEGTVQKIKGQAQNLKGDAKNKLKDGIDKA